MSGRLALAVVGVALGGCLESFDPDVGEPLRPLCTDEDSDPDEDVSFADPGYTITYRVTNEGTRAGRAKCQLIAMSESGRRLLVIPPGTRAKGRSACSIDRDLLLGGSPCW